MIRLNLIRYSLNCSYNLTCLNKHERGKETPLHEDHINSKKEKSFKTLLIYDFGHRNGMYI